MAALKVRIELLPAMWVAAVVATGDQPEAEAWRRLRAWAEPRGLWSDFTRHPVFGFNNPSPRPGTSRYGYELWLRIDEPANFGDGVTFKKFEGGWFAVTECRAAGEPGITATWRILWEWVQRGPYRWRRTQELEKSIDPAAPIEGMALELYLPIEPPA